MDFFYTASCICCYVVNKDRYMISMRNCVPWSIEKYILSGNFKGE